MILQRNILKEIITEYRHDWIEQLDVRWFDGDHKYIFHAIAYIHLGKKKAPTYEEVKGILEMGQDLKKYIRESCLKTLDTIISFDGMLTDDPIHDLKKEYEKKKIHNGLEKISKLTHDNKKIAIKELADDLSETVSDHGLYDLGKEINNFAAQLETGEANDHLKYAIEIKDYRFMPIYGKRIMPFPYCIGSRPGGYKTSILIALMDMFNGMGKKGLFFSMEDPIEMLRNKYIASSKNVPLERVITANKDPELAAKISNSPNKRIHVVDKNQDVRKFRSNVDGYMRKYDIDYIMVDYLQLFSGEKDPIRKIEFICNEFMYICKDYKVPIIFTSQVNDRDTSQKEVGSRLHMGHLKGSGAIEAVCCHIAMIYGPNDTTKRIINVDKNRFGNKPEKEVDFDGPSCRYLGVTNNDITK